MEQKGEGREKASYKVEREERIVVALFIFYTTRARGSALQGAALGYYPCTFHCECLVLSIHILSFT